MLSPLTIDEQGRRMKALYPDFRCVLDAGWLAVWEGPLQPISQTYRVRIRYFARRQFENWMICDPYVTVTVIEPPVGPDPRGTGEPPPHVFRLGHPPEFPALCLYDSRADEWSPEQLIAETIVPWTIHWLYWFEVWLLTGEWRGGGRHPEVEPEPWLSTVASDRENAAQRARRLNAGFHRIGRQLGAFGSYRSMVGVSAASFPPLLLHSLNNALYPVARSEATSTSSLEPLPAASLHLALAQASLQPNFASSIWSAATRCSRRCPTPSSAD